MKEKEKKNAKHAYNPYACFGGEGVSVCVCVRVLTLLVLVPVPVLA